jgi:cytochrome P450
MSIDLDSFTVKDQAFVEEPYETFRILREKSPVHKVDGLGFLITRYADAVAICRDPTTFSSKYGPGSPDIAPKLTETAMKALSERTDGIPAMMPTLLTTDPPEHRRYRSLTNPTFSPPRVRCMHESIQKQADALIDKFADAGTVELVQQFAIVFPLMVIADQLGMPAEDTADLARWMKYGVAALGGMLTEEEWEELLLSQLELNDYLAHHVQSYRTNPKDDLIGDLVSAEIATEEGLQPLSDAEIISIAMHYLVAGHETTAKLIGNGVWLFLTQPDQLELLRSQPDLMPNAVEEVLRYESPVQSMTRTAVVPTEVSGVKLQPEDRCIIMNGACNRDPEEFPDPDRFDITRENARHSIAFAHAEPYCLGANLARAEGAIAFETLFRRLPNLRLSADNDFTHQPTWVHRGFNKLNLDFDPA